MNEEIIEKVISAKSERPGMMPGMLIEGKWVNATDMEAAEAMKSVEKGATAKVTFVTNEAGTKFIKDIIQTKAPEKKAFGGGWNKTPIDKYDNSAFYNGCMINAVQYVNNTPDTLPSEQWATLVANYTKELVKAIKLQQSFGPPTVVQTNTTETKKETSNEVKNDATEQSVGDTI